MSIPDPQIDFHPLSSIHKASASPRTQRNSPVERMATQKLKLQPSKKRLPLKANHAAYFQRIGGLRKEIKSLREEIDKIADISDIPENNPDTWIEKQLQSMGAGAKLQLKTIETFNSLFESGFDDFREKTDIVVGIGKSLAKVYETWQGPQEAGTAMGDFTQVSYAANTLGQPLYLTSAATQLVAIGFKYRILSRASSELQKWKAELKENPNEALEQKITQFESWISKSKKTLKKETINYGLLTARKAPEAVLSMASLVNEVSKSSTMIASGFSAGINILLTGYALHRAYKNEQTINTWTQSLSPTELSIDLTPSQTDEIDKERNKIRDHLAQQKEILEKSKEPCKAKLEQIKQIIETKETFEEIQTYLKTEKLDLEIINRRLNKSGKDEVASKEELLSREDVQNLLLEQLQDHTHMLQDGVRKALTNVVQVKKSLAKHFFSFRKKIAWASFGVAISTALVISLKLTGVLSGVALASTGFGLIGLGVLLLAAGSFYYYKHHRNVLSAKLNLSYIQMNLASIPNTFRKWKLARLGASKQALIDKTNVDLRSLSAQIKKVKAELDIEKLEKGVVYKKPFDPLGAHRQYREFVLSFREKKLEIARLQEKIQTIQKEQEEAIKKKNEDSKAYQKEIEKFNLKFKETQQRVTDAFWQDYHDMFREQKSGSRERFPPKIYNEEKLLSTLPNLLTRQLLSTPRQPEAQFILEHYLKIPMAHSEKSSGEIHAQITHGIHELKVDTLKTNDRIVFWNAYMKMIQKLSPQSGADYQALLDELPELISELISTNQLDEKTKTILSKDMGLNIELLTQEKREPKELKEALLDGIKNFFGMDEYKLLAFVKQEEEIKDITNLAAEAIAEEYQAMEF
jgi:hypothetical protein